MIACAESWEDIELYGRSKQAWLETFLALPNGIPSHDTFRRGEKGRVILAHRAEEKGIAAAVPR